MRTDLERVGSDVASAEGDAMNINDTALMVVAFACLGIIVGACVFTVELYRELKIGIAKWRIRHDQKDYTRVDTKDGYRRRLTAAQNGR